MPDINKIREYEKAHCRCPDCGYVEIETWGSAVMRYDVPEPRDTNPARCVACDWLGIVHDLIGGATDGQEPCES